MKEGFEDLKASIESQNENLLNRRRLRLQSNGNFFPDREWMPRVLIALIQEMYISSFPLWNRQDFYFRSPNILRVL